MTQLAVTKIGQAIINNNYTELKWLLSNGEDVFYQDRKGNTYLHFICTLYRPDCLFVYLLHVNCLFQKGNTYLHFICTLYRSDCLFVCNLFVYLLHVNCLFQKGNTYLHFICTLYRPDCLFTYFM